MEKNADNQKVNGNQEFVEFLKSRKISDIFARPDTHIRDNINYLTGLKEHYPNVLNFIQFAQNLYKDDPDPSVNYVQINSFLKSNNEIIEPLNPYWNNFDTTKILNGLCENDSVSKIGKNGFKITDSLSNDNNANVSIILLDEKIRGNFRRKKGTTFKEIHEFIDSHIIQNYTFKEKWQPADSYKILKYYEKNLEGFIVKKKLSKQGSFQVDRHNFFVGRYFPFRDGNVLIKVDKNFVYCYPSINLKEGIDQAPVIFDRITWDRIQFYQVLLSQTERSFTYKKSDYRVGTKFPTQIRDTVIVRVDKERDEIKVFPDLGAKEQPVIIKISTGKKLQIYVPIDKYGAHYFILDKKGRLPDQKRYMLGKIHKNKNIAMDLSNPLTITYYPEQDIDKPGIVFNKISRKKIQFNQDLEENGGFVYENKIYSFPEYAGKKVLIKIDEIEKKILCFPHGNLEEEPLVRPINESEVVQFFKKKFSRNNFTYNGILFRLWNDFPSRKVVVTVIESENRIYIYPDLDFNKPPQILDLLTGKRIQFYQKLRNNGKFQMNGVKFDVGEKYKNKLAIVKINDEKNEISVFPDRNLNEIPLVFNKTTGKRKKIGEFYQDLEENGGFVYEDKIYSFPDHAGKRVLIKIDKIENQILCFPEGNLEEEPLVRPINESKVVQFLKEISDRNRYTCMGKSYSVWNDFPSKNVAVTVNESENRIYIHPDQDLSKPPRIIDKLTGIPIQYYKKLLKGHFYRENRKLDVGEEHKYKLAVIRINEEKNEIYVFPDRNLNNVPLVFNKTTGKRKKISNN